MQFLNLPWTVHAVYKTSAEMGFNVMINFCKNNKQVSKSKAVTQEP